MDAMSSGNRSDTEPMFTDILEYIRDGSQYHPIINKTQHQKGYIVYVPHI